MNKTRIFPGIALIGLAVLVSGCYTQFATTEQDPFEEQQEGVTYAEEDTTGAAGYYDSRERFYSEYYVTHPYSFTIGISYWDPWRYPGYGYGGWWYYDPWYTSIGPWYNPYYSPYAHAYWWGGMYACYPYYPYYCAAYAGEFHGRPSGVRTFGSRRATGPARVTVAGSGGAAPGLARPSSSTSPSFLPGGARSTSPRGGTVSGKEGGSRPAPSSTTPASRTGSARDRSRGERMPAYTPPPPRSRETPRRDQDRPSGGSRSYSPPPSQPSPPPSSPPPSSSPREGGGKSGNSGSGGGRSGSRR